MRSAHDCAEGGLAVTLAECAFGTGGIGLDVDLAVGSNAAASALADGATLFSESASRVVVSVARAQLGAFLDAREGARRPGARDWNDRNPAHPRLNQRADLRSISPCRMPRPSGIRPGKVLQAASCIDEAEHDDQAENRCTKTTAGRQPRRGWRSARQIQGRVRRVRHLRPSRSRQPDLSRALRAAASRAGERGHRGIRRRTKCASRSRWATSPMRSPRRRSRSCPATSPSATSAIRRPATASVDNAQPHPDRLRARADRHRRTTATS